MLWPHAWHHLGRLDHRVVFVVPSRRHLLDRDVEWKNASEEPELVWHVLDSSDSASEHLLVFYDEDD